MKQYFIAYRFSGESPSVLAERMTVVQAALIPAGIIGYSNLAEQMTYDREQTKTLDIMKKAFEVIDNSDGLFVLVASDDKSEGQLMEVGYAYAQGKHIIAAIKTGTKTYVDSLANTVIFWDDHEDLTRQLKEITV